MKVLYILEDARFGGMAKMVVELASGVRQNHFECELLIGEEDSETLIKKIERAGLTFHTINLHYLAKNRKAIFAFAFFFVPDLLKLLIKIKASSADIIYCNGSQHIKAVIAARLLGKKVIWHMHDTYQHRFVLLLFKCTRKLFNIQNFIASSHRTIHYYKLPITTTLLSLPPVDINEFCPQKKEPLGLTGQKTMTTVANINPDKGLDTLIRAVSIVNQRKKEVNFQVVGLIPESQNILFSKLKLLAKELKVKNLNFIGPSDNIYSILNETDIYICSSNNESGPISVFEAMAMELPIICTNVGDLSELNRIKTFAKMVSVGDYQSMANEILALLDNELARQDLGKNGRFIAQNHLDIRLSFPKHRNFYLKLLKST